MVARSVILFFTIGMQTLMIRCDKNRLVMQRSVKKLRPKANKLFSFSANWKRSNKELNIQLGEQLLTLSEKESFPKAIELFFKIKSFKEILENLSNGSMWKNVYIFTDEDHHPPKEIQKVQTITSAFQKICSISHYPNYPHDPIAKAKLLMENIHDYLFVLYKLKTLECRISKKIKKEILTNIHHFIKEFKKIKNLEYKEELKALKAITANSITLLDMSSAHRIIASLHLCSSATAHSKAHKILNQMNSEIELAFDSISKNAPFILPYAIKKTLHEQMKISTSSSSLYSALLLVFNDCKYEIIKTKQKSHSENVFEALIPLHILEQSLEKISHEKSLPKQFTKYYQSYYTKVKSPLSQIESFNSQIGYFLCGFYQTQSSYLLELLNNPSPKSTPVIDLTKADALLEKIILFLQIYAQIKPEILQEDITHTFTNATIKDLSLKDAKSYITNTLSFILPEKKEDTFVLLEKQSRKILTSLLAIYKSMDPKSFAATLLKEKIKGIYLMDIPSFNLGWYLFGEIVSILYILSSLQNNEPTKQIETFLINVYQHPIFSVLLNKKSSSLPQVLIKLQMI